MIYLLGGAVCTNFGDDLMLRLWLDYIAENKISQDVVIDGWGNKETFAEHQARSPLNLLHGPLNSLKKNKGGFWKEFSRGLSFFDRGGFDCYPTLKQWNQIMKPIKVLHLHGGGYLNNIWTSNGLLLGISVAIKRRYGCRLAATGIGLTPWPEVPDDLCLDFEEALNEFDFFELRDVESFDCLKKHCSRDSIIFGLDDAFLLKPTLSHDGPFTLHLSHFGKDGADMVEAVETLRKLFTFDRYCFWKASSGDKNICDELARAFPDMNLVEIERQNLVYGPYPVTVGDIMVTSRFHPHLVAARHGARGVFLRYDKGYYAPKHGSLLRLGSPFVHYKQAHLLKDQPLNGQMLWRDKERVLSKYTLADRIYADLP